MNCPKCNGKSNTYYTSKEKDCVNRIHECIDCGYRFNTVEIDADLYASLAYGSAKKAKAIKKK